MAAAVFEAIETGEPHWRTLDVRVQPGVTAMLAAAALAGAPLGADFCAISLSDNLSRGRPSSGGWKLQHAAISSSPFTIPPRARGRIS